MAGQRRPVEGDGHNHAAGLRVLVVDGNRDAADSLRMLLSLVGHICRVAYTGPAALKLAESFRPHVLFAEMILPELNGLQLAHDLRARLGNGTPLLIALTGLGRREDHERTQAAGYRHHLVKPADPLRLLELLADARASLKHLSPLPSR